jgi:hypothetical protein
MEILSLSMRQLVHLPILPRSWPPVRNFRSKSFAMTPDSSGTRGSKTLPTEKRGQVDQ